ncbi:DUF4256 domain-containing protein [Jejudonia soesokkakensis]|uniref:DUF4256 domain-containing protein n=1 Tax=Jejudonia soesokkakensis TaxID=1323432 RepID=A0ABW2MVK9_9FLAO
MKPLTNSQTETLLLTLQERFEAHVKRHKELQWDAIEKKLKAAPEKLSSLHQMEATGGEPDVVGYDEQSDLYSFFDCAAESPIGRRSTCYDLEGLESRKAHKPAHNAIDMASSMGVKLLTETQYKSLQELGDFDTKTSSWLETPSEIRKKGGAIFGDFRFGRTFIYHNGAQSYYAGRGFRACLTV